MLGMNAGTGHSASRFSMRATTLPSAIQSRAGAIAESSILFMLLAILVLLALDPWRYYFFTGLADHWDPALMGQWLAWNAHNILHGKFILPDYNANFFYPHSYTLAFSEPLWPQSFVYALVYGLSRNPFLSFNATLLFFWALSGITMFALLRELGMARAASYFGALAYCLLPHRLAYYVEFNMELVFVVPLVFLCFIRWLRRQTLKAGLCFTLSFWIAAISVIYYAIILLIPLCCVFLVYAVKRPSILKNRTFLASAAVVGVVTPSLLALYLYPYAVLRLEGGFVRSLQQQILYGAQPLTYLLSDGQLFAHEWLKSLVPAKRSETVLFPGLTVSLLALGYWWQQGSILRKEDGGMARLLSTALAASWLVFAGVLLLGAFDPDAAAFRTTAPLVTPAAAAILLFTPLLVLVRRRDDDDRLFLTALGVAALLAFVLSWGPDITVGWDGDKTFVGPSPLRFLFTHFALFGAIRVTSRFSIVVLTYLVVAGCYFLDRVIRRRPRLLPLWALLTAALVSEGLWAKPYAFQDYSDIWHDPLQEKLRSSTEEITLLKLPAGPRGLEAVALVNTIGQFHLTINGHSGFFPPEHQRIFDLVGNNRIPELNRWLKTIWPPVRIVIDKAELDHWRWRRWSKVFKQLPITRLWEEIGHDDRYVLLRLRPGVERADRIVRRIRSDVLRDHPLLHFEARAPRGGKETGFRLAVNGREVTRGKVGAGWRSYSIEIPPDHPARLAGDEVVLTRVADRDTPPWEVRDIRFTARGGR